MCNQTLESFFTVKNISLANKLAFSFLLFHIHAYCPFKTQANLLTVNFIKNQCCFDMFFAFRFPILLLGPISPIPIFRYFDTQMSIFPIFQQSNVNISNNSFKQTLHQQQLLSTSNDNFVCCMKLYHYIYIIIMYI